MRALRPDVRLDRTDEDMLLVDTTSGFVLGLPPLSRDAVDALDRGVLPANVDGDLREALSAVGFLDEGLSSAEIASRQTRARLSARAEERLSTVRAAVARARVDVPLYRERLASFVLDETVDLSCLPETTKRDIRHGFPEQVVADGVDLDALLASKSAFLNSTSGTSGERLEVISDARVPVLPNDYFTFFGIPRELEVTRAAVLTSPICAGFECHLGLATMEERTRGTMLTLNSSDDPLALSDAEVDAILEEISCFAPRAIFVNPWYASALVMAARRRGKSIPQVPLVFSTYQMITVRQRHLLAGAFGARVFSIYSATELGGYVSGTECAAGRLHVREDHVHIDLAPIDHSTTHGSDGHGFAPGVGRVLVTTLKNRIMPLVRYAVGDLAAFGTSCTCAMGEEWPTLELHGRLADFIVGPDSRRHSIATVDAHLGADAPIFYRVVQHERNRFRIEGIDDDARTLDAAVERLRGFLGPEADVVGECVTHMAPERSLKYRQVFVASGVMTS
jgi:phenylacetate-CoA ligase